MLWALSRRTYFSMISVSSCRVIPVLFLLAMLLAESSGVVACVHNDLTPVLHVFDGVAMGTTYTVRVVTADSLDPSRRNRIRDRIQAVLEDIESKMSHYRSTSELSRFNQTRAAVPFHVSPETLDVVRQANELSEQTEGALDITVGPLVSAWGFGPIEPETLPPSSSLLEQIRTHVGYTKLEFDPIASTLRKTDPHLECDLSAVAKGYGVDRVAAALREEALTRFMVEVGGEIVTVGLNREGRPWRIAIERPVAAGGVQRVVSLSDQAMATSGSYRNVRQVDGHWFSHTIDPRTGRPVEHQLASVSVIAPLCVVADGLATALEVLGPEEGYRLAVKRGWAALFLVRVSSGYIEELTTPAFEALLTAAASVHHLNSDLRMGIAG